MKVPGLKLTVIWPSLVNARADSDLPFVSGISVSPALGGSLLCSDPGGGETHRYACDGVATGVTEARKGARLSVRVVGLPEATSSIRTTQAPRAIVLYL